MCAAKTMLHEQFIDRARQARIAEIQELYTTPHFVFAQE